MMEPTREAVLKGIMHVSGFFNWVGLLVISNSIKSFFFSSLPAGEMWESPFQAMTRIPWTFPHQKC